MGYMIEPQGDQFHIGPDLYDHRQLTTSDQVKYNLESISAYIRQSYGGVKNKVIKGLQTSISQDATHTSKLSVTIQPGIAIIDGILFVLEDTITTDISLTYGDYPVDHGLLIANISVERESNGNFDKPIIHLTFVDPSGTPKPFFYHTNKNFIIGVFAISRDPTTNDISLINTVTETYSSGGIIIDGRDYRSYYWRPENALVIPTPISHFTFEGEIKDVVAGQSPTTEGTGFTYIQGRYGDYGISFDGSSGQGSTFSPYHHQFETNYVQTAGWFRIPSGVTSGTFLCFIRQGSNNVFYKLFVNGTQFGIRSTDGMSTFNRTVSFTPDTWFFWAHTILGYSINMKFGTWNSVAVPPLRNTPLELCIGDDISNEGPDPATGDIDQLRIYDGRLTHTVAELLYQESE